MNKYSNLLFSIAFCLLLLTSACSNPFKSETKKEAIKVLVNEYFDDEELGKWIFYWDGKNSKGKYITPGKYIFAMEARNFQDQDFVTAEEGGIDGENNKADFEPGFWLDFELGQAFPNPFPIKSGVNIPVLISEPGKVKISIFKD